MRGITPSSRRRALQPRDAARMDNALQFMRLMWALDHELQRVSKRMGRRFGITGPQRLVLLLLGQMPGMSAGELARLLHLDPSTLTGILRRLEDAGLVVRAADQQDSRRAQLALSDAGRAANRQRTGTIEHAVRRALNAVSVRDFDGTRRTLERIAAELQHAAAD